MKTSAPLDNGILKVHRADYLFWCATHSSLLGSPLQPLQPPPLLNTSRQSASAMVLQLPPELLLEIFSYLTDSQTTLYAISMVCRSWMACVSPLLYRHAKIADTYRWATFIVTLTRTKKMLDYGAHVQSVCLFASREYSESFDPLSSCCLYTNMQWIMCRYEHTINSPSTAGVWGFNGSQKSTAIGTRE